MFISNFQSTKNFLGQAIEPATAGAEGPRPM